MVLLLNQDRVFPREAHLPSDTNTTLFLRFSAHMLYDYKGTSLIRNSALLGPFSRTMHRALWWILGRGRFRMSEVPLY